ncbi:hypothetical protein GT034_16700 [Streptomyces sp. SID2563]|uniref:hypothetical protein n=1 Tax=Streptomyces sp. SID2563 TaxID=2690255 RepID=UPI0013FC0A37|nr:hypothetical protein [Streptomyces sp. SID2563]MYW09978.1 hypothetical protein [Streptomyces sp. SID2563]
MRTNRGDDRLRYLGFPVEASRGSVGGRFTAVHLDPHDLTPERATPAATWLRWRGHDPLLLAELGRARLLDAVGGHLPGADGT